MGAAEITLSGSREDYRLRIDKGLGQVTVDGKTVRSGDVVGDGAARVALTGGMGRITVAYAPTALPADRSGDRGAYTAQAGISAVLLQRKDG